MSIYPGGKPSGLRFKWEIAALNVPTPDDLISPENLKEWESYIACLSPGQQLRKLAEALDEFHRMIEDTSDACALPEAEQFKLYSKWCAANDLAVAVGVRLNYVFQQDISSFNSDLDQNLYLLTDFLRSISSPDLQDWENRRMRHNQIDNEMFDKFLMQSFEPRKAAAKPSPSP